MTENNISITNFGNYKFYDALLSIDNELLKTKLNDTYIGLKEYHTANGRYTEKDIEQNITYDPGYYLDDYNIFTFNISEMQELMLNLKTLLKLACEDYKVDMDKEQYQIHGWLNYFPGKMYQTRPYEELYWHDHGNAENQFHGYYAVNAEPSITHYRFKDEKLDRNNKNGRLVLAKTGIEHAVGKWDFDEPRISIAYNIVPKSHADGAKFSNMPIDYIPLT